MTIKLKQSTASQEIPLGHFVDDADGKTAETGLTIANTDIKLWKMGATSLASKNSGGGTHMAGGVYSAVLDATDTNTLGALIIFCQVAGALPVRLECEVLAANIYDSLIAGTDILDVSTTQFNGSAVTASSGRPEVNTTHAAGTAWGSGAITAASLAADALTAAKVAADVGTEIGTAVWATAARTLTAGTNIALAKGTGVTGFNDLSAAQVNAEVDTGIADAALATAANLAAAKTVVDSILVDTAEIGAAGAGLTAVPWNASWDAEVQSEATDALNAYDPPTNAEMTARTLATASYATAANQTAIAGYIDTEVGAIKTVVDAIKLATDNLPADPADASVVAGLIAAAQALIEDIQARIPAALVNGRIDANISAVNDIAITGSGTELVPWGPA